nr:2-oxoglutarate-dependent dioxygenase AOP3-like [Penaeus vannamei]
MEDKEWTATDDVVEIMLLMLMLPLMEDVGVDGDDSEVDVHAHVDNGNGADVDIGGVEDVGNGVKVHIDAGVHTDVHVNVDVGINVDSGINADTGVGTGVDVEVDFDNDTDAHNCVDGAIAATVDADDEDVDDVKGHICRITEIVHVRETCRVTQFPGKVCNLTPKSNRTKLFCMSQRVPESGPWVKLIRQSSSMQLVIQRKLDKLCFCIDNNKDVIYFLPGHQCNVETLLQTQLM